MREILFRGKDDNNNWCYGYAIIGKRFKWASILPIDTIDDAPPMFDECEVELDTVGQYTGLKDKNGTKIFEGDIVKGCSKSYKKNYLCEVYFNENMCHYGLTINRGSYTKHQTHDWLELTKTKALKLEVIGNIYDNPELLEGL